jgi:hypothetical protein
MSKTYNARLLGTTLALSALLSLVPAQAHNGEKCCGHNAPEASLELTETQEGAETATAETTTEDENQPGLPAWYKRQSTQRAALATGSTIAVAAIAYFGHKHYSQTPAQPATKSTAAQLYTTHCNAHVQAAWEKILAACSRASTSPHIANAHAEFIDITAPQTEQLDADSKKALVAMAQAIKTKAGLDSVAATISSEAGNAWAYAVGQLAQAKQTLSESLAAKAATDFAAAVGKKIEEFRPQE